MNRKTKKPKESAIKSQLIVADDLSNRSTTTSAKSSKANKAGIEKQKTEEENAARERQRILRSTPNVYGLSLDDYTELFTSSAPKLSNICSRIFRYSNGCRNHRSAFLDHLYVRAMHDLRQFTKDEEVFSRLVDLFLSLLSTMTKDPPEPSSLVGVLGTAYSSFVHPVALLTEDALEALMLFYIETIIHNFNLYRYALTTPTVPVIFMTNKQKIRLPNEDSSSSTFMCPLVEAIPARVLKSATVHAESVFLADQEKMLIMNVNNPDYIMDSSRIENGEFHSQFAASFMNDQEGLTESDVQAVVHQIATWKFKLLQQEVETAIENRKNMLNLKIPNKKN